MTEFEKTELMNRVLAMSNEEKQITLMCIPSNYLVGEIYNRLIDGEQLRAKIRELSERGCDNESTNQKFGD